MARGRHSARLAFIRRVNPCLNSILVAGNGSQAMLSPTRIGARQAATLLARSICGRAPLRAAWCADVEREIGPELMRRYFFSPIVGTGTSSGDPFRAKVRDVLAGAGNYVAVIPTGVDGKPLFAWCLVLVSAPALTALLADADLNDLPDITLDAKLSTLTAQQRTRALNFLTNHGIDTSGLTVNSTFRAV